MNWRGTRGQRERVLWASRGRVRGVEWCPQTSAIKREADRAETAVEEIEDDDVMLASSTFLFIYFSVFFYNF